MTKKAKSKLAKLAVSLFLASAMVCAGTASVSAATVSHGISGDLTVGSQTDSGAEVTATVKNANYYDIDGINYKVSVSDNAEISGETQKTEVSLPSEKSDSLTVNISLKSENPSDTSSDKTSSATNPEKSESPSDTASDTATSATNPEKSESPSGTASDTATSATNSEPTHAGTVSTEYIKNVGTTVTDGKTAEQSAINTGDDSIFAVIALIIAIMLVSVSVVFAAVKKNRRMMSVILCFTLVSSVLAVSMPMLNANAADVSGYTVIEDNLELKFADETVTVTLTVEFPEQPEIHDNTEADIKALNNGDATILRYKDSNEVSFINGRYTDYKVTNWETALSSFQAVKTLLNVNENYITVNPVRTDVTDNGDTYYTFEQVQGLATVSDAFIKIGVDKDGNTLCLSSSIDPTATMVDVSEDDVKVSKEKAKEIAENYCEQYGYNFVYNEQSIPVIHKNVSLACCWVFYLKPTDSKDSENTYLKIYINTQTGEVFDTVSVSSIDPGDSENYNNDVYFNVETQNMTFTDRFGRNIELPVAKDDSGYYFIDTERKMICIDSETSYDNKKDMLLGIYPYYFDSVDSADPILVTVFENMRKVYDAYKSNGITSVDGMGIPLAIGYGYLSNGEEIPGACYVANSGGFGCFQFGKTDVSIAIDTAAHEYGHAVRSSYNCAGTYANNAGAIEEAYGDIFGNLIEMATDSENADMETWLLGEESGSPIRCMSNPHSYYQPEYIGDVYFSINSIYTYGDNIDDCGGTHTNNSILSYVCYQMTESGISLEDNFSIWKNTIYTLTPLSEFKEVSEMVRYSMKRLGFADNIDTVNSIFENAKIDNDTTSWDGYDRPEGAVELKLSAQNVPDDYVWSVLIWTLDPKGNLTPFPVSHDINDVAQIYLYPGTKIEAMYCFRCGEEKRTSVAYAGELSSDMSFDVDFNTIPEIPAA